MRDIRAHIITKITRAMASLSITGRIVLWTCIVIFVSATVWMLCDISLHFIVTVPERGGSLTLGSVGSPQLINPVLAISTTDKDMVTLIYSGLTRWDISQHKLIPDLADHWTISPDGTIYTFTLKKGLTFQDGTPITADDVVFTVHAIQNPQLQSPLAANWAGVTVKKIDRYTVQFILPAPYAPFIENTTVGILPAHLWQNLSVQEFVQSPLNSKPVGSGPYKIGSINQGSGGTPISYTLVPFRSFALGEPYISTVTVNFYQDTATALAAAASHQVNELDDIPDAQSHVLAGDGFSIDRFPLPRVFGVFFNQSQNVALTDPVVRQALTDATDHQAIVKAVFGGTANPLYGPVPTAFLNMSAPATTSASTTLAATLLDKDGWILNTNGIREKKRVTGTTTLSFAISTDDTPELVAVANLLASQWRAIGADVAVKVFQSGFEDQVIQPRNYDALLFGQDVGRDFDLYPFWASSEIANPGLNIALYKNPTADILLDELRATTSPEIRQQAYVVFAHMLSRDVPAVFLYEPDLIDARQGIAGGAVGPIANENERLNDIYHWYVETQDVWKMFASIAIAP